MEGFNSLNHHILNVMWGGASISSRYHGQELPSRAVRQK